MRVGQYIKSLKMAVSESQDERYLVPDEQYVGVTLNQFASAGDVDETVSTTEIKAEINAEYQISQADPETGEDAYDAGSQQEIIYGDEDYDTELDDDEEQDWRLGAKDREPLHLEQQREHAPAASQDENNATNIKQRGVQLGEGSSRGRLRARFVLNFWMIPSQCLVYTLTVRSV